MRDGGINLLDIHIFFKRKIVSCNHLCNNPYMITKFRKTGCFCISQYFL